MKLIVTGAAGFIGSHVAERLEADGHQVLGIDDLSGGRSENVPSGVRFEQINICAPLDDLFSAFRPAAVYHLAAYAAEGLSHHIPTFNYQNNLVGTANVLKAAYRAGARHFTFTSSIAAYGHPEQDTPFDETTVCRPCDPYGVAKLACEQHLQAFFHHYGRPSYTIFRPHNVFGPRQNISDPYRNVVGIFMHRAMLGLPMPIFGDGLQTRSFSYIASVAACIADAPFVAAAENRVFNVGGDEPMAVLDLSRHLAELFQVPCKIEWLPARNEVVHAHCRHERVRETFPGAFGGDVGIVEGLRRTAEYVRRRPIPAPTECPAPIEIPDLLPPSWANRPQPPCAAAELVVGQASSLPNA